MNFPFDLLHRISSLCNLQFYYDQLSTIVSRYSFFDLWDKFRVNERSDGFRHFTIRYFRLNKLNMLIGIGQPLSFFIDMIINLILPREIQDSLYLWLHSHITCLIIQYKVIYCIFVNEFFYLNLKMILIIFSEYLLLQLQMRDALRLLLDRAILKLFLDGFIIILLFG